MPKAVGDYLLYYKIGQGATAKVYFGSHVVTKENFAIKVVPLPKEEQSLSAMPAIATNNGNQGGQGENQGEIPIKTQTTIGQIRREIYLMKHIDHPNIIKIKDNFIENGKYYVVMEFAGNGPLESYVNGHSVSVNQAMHYFTQIVDALNYLHNDCKIVHRDLKADNILITEKNEVKISDFGLSRFIPQDKEAMMKTRCGSPCYVAPEVIMSNGYTEKTDVWSLGIVLYHMLVGTFPFVDDNIQRLFHKILKDDVYYPKNIEEDEVLMDLINGCLKKNPEERFSITQVMEHPCLTRMISNKSSSLPILYEYGPNQDSILNGKQGEEKNENDKNLQSLSRVRKPIISGATFFSNPDNRIDLRKTVTSKLKLKVASLSPGFNMPPFSTAYAKKKQGRRQSFRYKKATTTPVKAVYNNS